MAGVDGVALLEGFEGAGLVPAAFVAAAGVLAASLVRLDPVGAFPPAWDAVPPPVFENTVPAAAVGVPRLDWEDRELPVDDEKPVVDARGLPLVVGVPYVYANDETCVTNAVVPFVKILICWVVPSVHVPVNTMTVELGSITPTVVEPRLLRVIIPSEEIDTVPFSVPDCPLLPFHANEYVPLA